MQTVQQILCPRCGALNLPYVTECASCRAALAPAPNSPLLPSSLAPNADTTSDLSPLVWALVCFFLAVWGLVAAGPLRGILGVLVQPYLLLAAALVSLIVTGIYVAERASREPRPHALISTKELMALSWTAAALLGAGQFLKYVLPAMPVIARYQI